MDARSPFDDSRERAPEDPRSVSLRPESSIPKVPDGSGIISRIAALREQKPRRVLNPKLGSKDSSASQPAPDGVPSAEPIKRDPERKPIERRPQRTAGPSQNIGLHLRPEEHALLYDVGRFRIVSVPDLARHLYGGQLTQLRGDLEYLRQRNLIEVHQLNARRDGRGGTIQRFEAVTLTKAAKKLLQMSGDVPEDQRIYSGLVKRREAEHDCQIYSAFQKELASLTPSGSRDVRVQLDSELKANFSRAVYLARKAQPKRDQAEIKQEVAEQLQLQINAGKVIVPDARLEYELPGGLMGQVEIEVATAAYRRGHLTAKARAGFKLYMSHGDIGRLGAGVQNDHDLMSEILDL